MKKVLILLAMAYFIVIGIFMFDKSRERKLKNDFESKLNLREEIIDVISCADDHARNDRMQNVNDKIPSLKFFPHSRSLYFR